MQVLEPTIAERAADILRAVDAMIAAHDEWESDPQSPDVPNQDFEDAVVELSETVLYGDTPMHCSQLRTAVDEFVEQWEEYGNGEHKPGGKPLDSFWSAYRAMKHAREGAKPYAPQQVESVTVLRQQKLSDLQIAKIYGVRNEKTDVWAGPFFDDNGRVLSRLIDQQEQAEQGKSDAKRIVESEWVHPLQLAEVNRVQKSNRTRIPATPPEASQENATVEEMLREGAFPAQIARVKGVSVEEVNRIASKIGVKPEDPRDYVPKADDAPNRTGVSIEKSEAGNRLMSVSEPKEESLAVERTKKSRTYTDAEIVAKITDVYQRDTTLGMKEIAAAVCEALPGLQLDGRRVRGVVRKLA